ncbi:MAG: metallopeptidase [Planctomycetota bacterium]
MTTSHHTRFACIALSVLLLVPLAAVFAVDEVKKPTMLPTAHTTRDIEGWTVRIDDRLLKGEGAAVGEKAIKLLTARLVAITIVVPEKALAKLRAIGIELDFNYGDLDCMQYHPDADWLKENGYSEKLAKCVHIPEVMDFLSPYENHRMPWVILHELSHGYHDQVLGFDEPKVKAAWKAFCETGKYKSVLTSPGHMNEHYALTDEKEFFAEMTECYFGSNDFYPFVTGELKQAEPKVFELLESIWGKLPQRTERKAKVTK